MSATPGCCCPSCERARPVTAAVRPCLVANVDGHRCTLPAGHAGLHCDRYRTWATWRLVGEPATGDGAA